MKSQATVTHPLTDKVYNRALAACWRDFWFSVVKCLLLFLAAVTTSFTGILIILLVVELICFWYAWQNVEDLRDGSGVFVYYEPGEEVE